MSLPDCIGCSTSAAKRRVVPAPLTCQRTETYTQYKKDQDIYHTLSVLSNNATNYIL